jgi:Cu/Zn superoxide dismutase
MSNRRLVAGLAALACAVALPAAASAHTVHAAKAAHGQPGKHRGHALDSTTVRLAPVDGQTAKGRVQLTQHDGALSVALVVRHLTPGTFYAAHVHAGTCAALDTAALTLPDLYADEDGVATLVTTLPTPGVSYVAGGFAVDVHSGPSSGATPTIACGDVLAKPLKAESRTRLEGTDVTGFAAARQKGGDVTVWIALRGLTPGVHAVHIHAGPCAPVPGTLALDLGTVTAGSDGRAAAKLTGSSSALIVGAGYSVDVQAGATVTPEAVAACGDQVATRAHGHH